MKGQYSLRTLVIVIGFASVCLVIFLQMVRAPMKRSMVRVLRTTERGGALAMEVAFDSGEQVGYTDYAPLGDVDVVTQKNGDQSFSQHYFASNQASRGSKAPTITESQNQVYLLILEFVSRKTNVNQLPAGKQVLIPIPDDDPDMVQVRKRLERGHMP